MDFNNTHLSYPRASISKQAKSSQDGGVLSKPVLILVLVATENPEERLLRGLRSSRVAVLQLLPRGNGDPRGDQLLGPESRCFRAPGGGLTNTDEVTRDDGSLVSFLEGTAQGYGFNNTAVWRSHLSFP